ncbi:MAG: penicillin-binding transpeptidase domain-containing protein [Gammaproteobacteria bacterium]|nr:penicillin-binding transpeptidase domain-containing protein [Gammaproteobacteria bacterium]MDE0302286.1 penicillin-binding transpeptidase domain-containing protein [Gammaproteobacteria bacterium]MDE0611600.1 penicillin-binding transpeptidase domain-containing protein [Gammaproteobacteria bacterium]
MKVARRVSYNWRRRLVLSLFLLIGIGLVGRAVQLQYAEQEFLTAQGESRQLRTVPIPASRGMLLDRHGEPLAISTPVQSVWAEPKPLLEAQDQWPELARLLGLSRPKLKRLVLDRQDRKFVYLRRQITPNQAEQVTALKIPGVGLVTEYRRYYPAGAVAAQLLGGTDIDDRGQEGLELAFDSRLRAQPGARQVRQDRHGRIIDDLAQLRPPKQGENLRLGIDLWLQYHAYQELQRAVLKHRAQSGTVVVLDVVTGEVLAMVQAPSYNPNGDRSADPDRRRNRAITDLYEPGSVMKPFTVLTALASGVYGPNDRIDTAPGHWRIGGHQISDIRNFGELDLRGVLVKSSNVAAARIALDLPGDTLWETLDRVGFGQPLRIGYPGEAVGILREPGQWVRTDQASLGYGYGLSATPLHIAQAYMVLGNRGVRHPISFLAHPQADGERMLPREYCDAVLRMMQGVTGPEGTARRVRLPGYTVAVKTGTVRKMVDGVYSDRHHVAMIAGVVPARHPRLAILVLVDTPRSGKYFGGEVAGPVFREVAREVLRLLNVPPDDRELMIQASPGGTG